MGGTDNQIPEILQVGFTRLLRMSSLDHRSLDHKALKDVITKVIVQEVNVTIITNDVCKSAPSRFYKKSISEAMICAF